MCQKIVCESINAHFYIETDWQCEYSRGSIIIPKEFIGNTLLNRRIKKWCNRHLESFLALFQVINIRHRCTKSYYYWWEAAKNHIDKEVLELAIDCEYITPFWLDFILSVLYEKTNPYKKPEYIRAKKETDHGYVYIIRAENNVYKIGKAKRLDERVNTFGVKLPIKTELYCSCEMDDYSKFEKDMHIRFAEKRVHGEWFNLTERDLEEIKALMGVS